MLFYELQDIEKMLDNTSDPIGDFINAASADVMGFGAANTYESLLERTDHLSELSTFPTVQSRMNAVGYTLNKVVYRGCAGVRSGRAARLWTAGSSWDSAKFR